MVGHAREGAWMSYVIGSTPEEIMMVIPQGVIIRPGTLIRAIKAIFLPSSFSTIHYGTVGMVRPDGVSVLWAGDIVGPLPGHRAWEVLE